MTDQTLPEHPDLADVFRAWPQAVRPLLEYHDILLRGESPLSVGQRELIAAYVSGLNACGFCLGAHSIIAEAFDIPEARITALLEHPDSAGIDPAMATLLGFVRKLTLHPSHVTPADRQTVYDAGWSQRALHDAVSVCALFNFMNRLVDGMGVETSPAIQAAQRQRHAPSDNPSAHPYMDYGHRIGAINGDNR